LPLSHNYKPNQEKKLKIGYIAHTLRSHPVGWLSRWLFQYLDRNKFELYIYLFIQKQNDPFFHEWFAQRVDRAVLFVEDSLAAAKRIRDDKIDILIDLDSITLDHTLAVMSLKPAPIQATWLGWDASGLPTIDYFLADPYVLPSEAEQHYHEKILRLPQTYIAVNGFEIDVPTIKRSDLGICSDSVVYYSSQSGIKCNPETIQLQLQIIKEIPNSYFLIKGLADKQLIQEMFLDLATEMNITADRLKFLPIVSTEMIHRANLGIADVVLDTFPYNGATTTLETLWMGIPLVTRVGTQFASRSSYSFLMNLGVSEGIAWSAEEYVEWGIRFGQDMQLRLDVTWKLRQSRKSSPLWNTKQFTRDMEQTYRSMWRNYSGLRI
jgi:predicted O-linked N-acetylglucosamine transferase (SPINDLY family)